MGFNTWLKQDGYLLFVHPRGWRQLNSKVGRLMKSKNIIYLNMNSLKMGIKTFKCSTDYDWYLIQNTSEKAKTKVNDYNNEEYEIYITPDIPFIANHSIPQVNKLLRGVEKKKTKQTKQKKFDNGFINDQSSYEPRRKWMSKTESNEYKYPCIYSINKKNEASLKWSKINDKGHFGVSKFIFSNGYGSIRDSKGEYGLTQWAYAIKCKSEEEMDEVEKAYNSAAFNNIVDAIQLTSNKYNYKVIKLFKRNFWREFV